MRCLSVLLARLALSSALARAEGANATRELIRIDTLIGVNSGFCGSEVTYNGINAVTNQCPSNSVAFDGGKLSFSSYSPTANTVTFDVCTNCGSGCLSSSVVVTAGACYQSPSNSFVFYKFSSITALGQIWIFQGNSVCA